MKILIVADVDGWAYDRVARCLKKGLEEQDLAEVTVENWKDHIFLVHKQLRMGQFDVAFLIEDYDTPSHMEMKSPKTKLIVGHNVPWVVDTVKDTIPKADCVIVNQRSCWENHFKKHNNSVYLPYSVDQDLFSIQIPWREREESILWTASNRRDDLKGYDDILLPLKDLLVKENMHLNLWRVSDKLHWKTAIEMAAMYNQSKYAICTSKAEATPTYLLEARACGCLPITTMVGNAEDWLEDGVNGVLIKERSVQGALEACLEAKKMDEAIVRQSYLDVLKNWSYERRAREFFVLVKELIETGTVRRREWPKDFLDLPI